MKHGLNPSEVTGLSGTSMTSLHKAQIIVGKVADVVLSETGFELNIVDQKTGSSEKVRINNSLLGERKPEMLSGNRVICAIKHSRLSGGPDGPIIDNRQLLHVIEGPWQGQTFYDRDDSYYRIKKKQL